MKFTEHLNESSACVNQLSEWMLSIISELEVSYISATDLADRRSNKQLLEEFHSMSAKLANTSEITECETGHTICTPYLLSGTNLIAL